MEKKRLALLVGCNYPNTQFRLRGCINDVVDMQDVLVKRFGFDRSNIKLLTDEPESEVKPTGANIKAALDEMVKEAQPGDVLFFHFSGHGTLIPSLEPGQPFRQDEAIVPCDLNLITDMDFRHLVNRLPPGASFTILSDSCHSGDLIEKEKEQIGPDHSPVKTLTPIAYHGVRGISPLSLFHCLQEGASQIYHGATEVVHGVTEIASGIGSMLTNIKSKDVSLKFRTPDQTEKDFLNSLEDDMGILLSGCQVNEISADLVASEFSGGKAHGAFTSAVLKVLNGNQDPLSNKELVMNVREILKEQGFKQHPCLYCSDQNAIKPFLGLPTSKPVV